VSKPSRARASIAAERLHRRAVVWLPRGSLHARGLHVELIACELTEGAYVVAYRFR